MMDRAWSTWLRDWPVDIERRQLVRPGARLRWALYAMARHADTAVPVVAVADALPGDMRTMTTARDARA